MVPNDGDLVRLALIGHMTAFAALYVSNVGAVTTVVRAGINDPEVAADVVQDIFVRALERLRSLREPDRFRPWLLAIARHAVIDRQRIAGRSLVGQFDQEPACVGPSTEELAEVAELAELLAGCVAGLSRRDATAVSMVANLGCGPQQVAAALGVTRQTAKVIVHRARHRLRDALALELMVRRRGPGCPGFDALGADDVVAAARHVRTCGACAEMVGTAVGSYAAPPGLLGSHAAAG